MLQSRVEKQAFQRYIQDLETFNTNTEETFCQLQSRLKKQAFQLYQKSLIVFTHQLRCKLQSRLKKQAFQQELKERFKGIRRYRVEDLGVAIPPKKAGISTYKTEEENRKKEVRLQLQSRLKKQAFQPNCRVCKYVEEIRGMIPLSFFFASSF